jgi:glycosyltransferase involved in cell wall biosynthesis
MNGIGSVDDQPGVSGGDVRWIEIAKCWQNSGHTIHVFTPNSGKELCQRLGLTAIFHINEVPNDYSIKTYLVKYVKARFIPESLENFKGVIYSTTEHFYDVLPALKIKEKNRDAVWVAVVHWVAPLKRNGTSLLNSFLFYLNQQEGFHYIRKAADVVLTVSDSTLYHVKRIGIKKNVHSVDAGVAFNEIRKTITKVDYKQYDAVFMKRLDGTKGVFDIVEIWKDVVKKKPNARLGIVGLGTKSAMDKLNRMITNFGLSGNVDVLGPIYDFEKKISVLGSSKLFVLPSYEENWAIVIGEAMAAGVPVLCYNIPEIKPIWGNNVTWIPKGNKEVFAIKILELLAHPNLRTELSKNGVLFINRYDWREIAEKELNLIRS